MREILFRGKREGKWIEGSLVRFPDDTTEICYSGEKCDIDELDKATVATETVGQFTGLTDKNGKRIFEGDVVKHFHEFYCMDNYMIREVWWDDENCCFRLTTPNGISGRIVAGEKYEVIGNIHDNPELFSDND